MSPADVERRDYKTKELIDSYTWGAAGTMFAIPIPGADMAATYAVWAKMISAIAKAYNYEVSAEDAKRLASDLFKGVVMTSLVWFGSAKLATGVLKLIPGAGTVTAYAVDAAIAAFGAKKITAGVGLAAAAYYKSGKVMAPSDLKGHVKNILQDPGAYVALLGTVIAGFPPDDGDIT